MALYVGNTKYTPMLGNNRASFMVEDILPYDAEIEYLESTGTQWIDLDIYGTLNTKIIFECCPKSRSCVVFGARTSATSNSVSILMGTNTEKTLIADFGNYQNTRCSFSNINLEDWFKISINKDLRSIVNVSNGTYQESTTAYTTSFTTPRTLKIGLKETGYPGTYGNYIGKIGKCQVFDANVLLLDLIPVRVGTTGYLLDKVEHKLYGNTGTGSFILGNDKN